MNTCKLLLGMVLAGALTIGCAATDYDMSEYDRNAAAAEPAPMPPANANATPPGPTNEQTAIPNEGNSAPRGQMPSNSGSTLPEDASGTGGETTNP